MINKKIISQYVAHQLDLDARHDEQRKYLHTKIGTIQYRAQLGLFDKKKEGLPKKALKWPKKEQFFCINS